MCFENYFILNQKKGLILNAVGTLRAMGWERPRVAVLCAVEKVNPRMKETVEAAELAEMNRSGEIPDCVVEGPISYDVAMDPRIAAIKGYRSENCGRFEKPCKHFLIKNVRKLFIWNVMF